MSWECCGALQACSGEEERVPHQSLEPRGSLCVTAPCSASRCSADVCVGGGRGRCGGGIPVPAPGTDSLKPSGWTEWPGSHFPSL